MGEMGMRAVRSFSLGLALAVGATSAPAQTALRPDQAEFRALYKELVETDTTLSAGDCTLAASKLAARMRAAGFPAADLHPFTAPGHPKEGGLVAVYPGRDPKAKAILLLAHIDVVEAKREDWTRDPFTLVEEGGYFYARGASDDKSQAAVWTDTLIRFQKEGFKPRRTVKMALTCGEETASAFNGADYLVKNERALIDAEFALNEGGGGRQEPGGKPVWLGLQVGEKFPQDYELVVTNPGGHSSRPVKDNAITHLSAGLVKIGAYDFPIELSDTTRAYFTKLGPAIGGAAGRAMTALMANPNDKAAEAEVTRDPSWNSTLRTTCVSTMLSGGHATNALPQRAMANVNCRIFPGTTTEQVRKALEAIVADPAIKISIGAVRSQTSKGVPLAANVLGPAEKLAAEMFPGVPVIPSMSTGATDGAFLTPAGVPTYGVPGILGEADGGGVHGLNERISVQSLYRGRDYMYRLVRVYAEMGD
jgi:acetylornithine deacetylase/succinyl-diaminopimelate desuccinylase-like protein